MQELLWERIGEALASVSAAAMAAWHLQVGARAPPKRHRTALITKACLSACMTLPT